MKTMTFGRMTFVAWKDKGMKIQGGRVLYHSARKYWLRIGAFIASVEIANPAT